MIRWIVGWSLKFRLLVIGLALGMLFVGIGQLRDMPVDALPEFAPPTVQIQTEALGLSASEVEDLITLNLEELLSGTPFLQSMRSSSVPSLSTVTLIFEPGTDILRARQLVSEKLSLAFALPNVSRPPTILPPVSATSRVMMVGLSSKSVSPLQMSILARWTLQPALLSVPGVANVAVWGMRDRQLQVLVDPKRLKAHHLTVDQIIASTGNALWVSPLTFLNASSPGTGGFIDAPQQRLEVRHVFPISSPQDLAKVSIDGTNLHLGDVANVLEDHQPLIGDDLLNDEPGLLVAIEKSPGANPLDVTRGVEAKLQELQPGLSGIHINSTVFRAANFIDTSISNIANTLFISCFLVLLLLLLYQWRVALICLATIPLSLVAAGLVLYLRGATMNAMTLAGLVLALGIIVDDVIIDVENIMRRLRQHRCEGSERSTASIILDASYEMRDSMMYATLIILLTLLPVFVLTGVSRSFFQPLAFSYALALLASMVAALTITPALCILLLSRTPPQRRESPILGVLQRGYSAVLGRIIRTPYAAFTAGCAFLLLGALMLPFLGQSLFPTFKESDIVVQWQGAPGTSYPEMVRITTLASRELRSVSGVRNVASLIGRAILGDQIVNVNSAQIVVSIDPTSNYDTTMAAIQQVVNGYPGIHHVVQSNLNDTIKQSLTGSSDDIVVRLYGNNLTTLRSKGEEVRQAIAQIDGVGTVHTGLQVYVPQIQVTVDLNKAQRYGLKPGDVRRAASTMVAGIEVGSLFEEQKVYSVVVMGTPDMRSSLTSVRELLIDTPSGGQVRLGDVADVSIQSAPSLIQHDTISRYIDVSVNVNGGDRSVVENAIKQRLQTITMPQEFHVQVLGEYQGQQALQTNLLVFGIIAALAIFLLLQAAFGSWRLATLAFFALPLALMGGVFAVLVTGGVVSLGSLVGFFTVFGISARNGTKLINHFQHLERDEGVSFSPELVIRGAKERLVPILMTALAVGLALLPLVVVGSIAGHEIDHPMAIVILGGLVTSTLLNLFIVPGLYLRFGSKKTNSESHTVRMEEPPTAQSDQVHSNGREPETGQVSVAQLDEKHSNGSQPETGQTSEVQLNGTQADTAQSNGTEQLVDHEPEKMRRKPDVEL